MERKFLRNDSFLQRLNQYCGKEARLFDSEHPRGWQGLEGLIVPTPGLHARSPYALSHYDLYHDSHFQYYIFIDSIRSIKQKDRKILIDTEWVHGGEVPRGY